MAAQDDDFPELENEEVIVENTAKRLAIMFQAQLGEGEARNTCPEVNPDSPSGCHLLILS